MVSEAGSRMLLHTLIVGVMQTGRRVEGVIVEGVDGRHAIRANVIIDATGDAIVSAKAGAELVGEETELRRDRQPMALVFRLAGVDVPTFRAVPREEKRRLVLQGIGQGDLFWESLAFSSTPANNDAICLLSRPRRIPALDQSPDTVDDVGFPRRRKQCTQLEESTSVIAGYSAWRSFISSPCVMKVSDVPKCFVSAAMRFRRLKSLSAVTTASRLVLAPVNRMASLSSFSGISMVVFMASYLTIDGQVSALEHFRHGRPPSG